MPTGATPPVQPTVPAPTVPLQPAVPIVHVPIAAEPSILPPSPPTGPRRLVRPRDRWIGGVCSGLGRRFGLSPNLVRVLFVLSCLLPGPQFIVYLMLWLIIPNE